MWRGRNGIGHEAYHLSMTTIHPECSGSDPSDLSEAGTLHLREEPDEEEDEEEDEDNKEDDDGDDTTDGGYSQ